MVFTCVCGNAGIAAAQTKNTLAKSDNTLYFAVPNLYDRIDKGFAPVIKHLSDELGRPVKLMVVPNDELGAKIQTGEIHVAQFGAALYVVTKREYPKLKYLATAQTTKAGKKRSLYFSWFITHKDSDVKKMVDLKGKTFAFVNKTSSSGYVYPRAYLKTRNIVPENYFKAVLFAGSHEGVTDKVAAREVDGGVTFDVNLWYAEKKHGKVFRGLKKLGPILRGPVAAHHEVDDALCRRLVAILTNLPHTVFNNDLPVTGYEELSDRSYDAIRGLME
jgi:phosphonate transport system substrate-binding protein